MPVNLEWQDVAIRLALAVLAGTLIGFNRGERGKPAGLRTTILVCLAAAVAMILGNLMISTRGKPADSFVQLDMMRLPLGVLTGIGFIGAGTILKRGDLVVGVTTAATVWFVTMIGLCFGAGRIPLGIAATLLGFGVVWGLSWVEDSMKQEHRGQLFVACRPSAQGCITEAELREVVLKAGCLIAACDVAFSSDGAERQIRYELRWRAPARETSPPAFLRQLAQTQGIRSVRWRG